MCALQSMACSAPSSSPQICVLIAESNCVHASLKKTPMLCLPRVLPLWRMLIIIVISGEIRALTSNLFSNATARNIVSKPLYPAPSVCLTLLPSGYAFHFQ